MEASAPDERIDQRIDREIDITAEACPMTFVLTRLALEAMAPGEVLAVRLRGEEPRRLVPRTVRREGHQILGEATGTDGITRLTIRKGTPPD